MLYALAFLLGLLLAFGLIKQVQTIVKRKRGLGSYLYKYVSIFGFVALFYQNEPEREGMGVAYIVGIVLGLAIGIVAKQRAMR